MAEKKKSVWIANSKLGDFIEIWIGQDDEDAVMALIHVSDVPELCALIQQTAADEQKKYGLRRSDQS